MEFQFVATSDVPRLNFLNVIVENSPLCGLTLVGSHSKAKDVVPVLEDLTKLYPALAHIRRGIRTGFIAQALHDWWEISDTIKHQYRS